MFLKYVEKIKAVEILKKSDTLKLYKLLIYKVIWFQTLLKKHISVCFIVTHLSRLFKSTLFNFNIWGLTLIWSPVLSIVFILTSHSFASFQILTVYLMVMEPFTIMNGSYLFILIVDDTPLLILDEDTVFILTNKIEVKSMPDSRFQD